VKLNNLFASSSEGVCSKQFFVKKRLTSALLALVIGASTLLFTSFQKQPLQSTNVSATEELAVQTLPRGLSRQRNDFDKALNILATAAAKDARLAAYYRHVEKRVTGLSNRAENASGVRIVKLARKSNPTATANPVSSNSIDVPPQSLPVAPPEMAEAAQAVDALPAPPVPDGYAQATTPVVADVQSSGLTVGDMAYDLNPAIERWVNYYTARPGGRQTMTIGIQRSNAYLAMARAEFRRVGVPEDLVWLAMVESVWNPSAVSPAAAGGIWQFIPKTATEYGLRVARGDDERADPLKQTRVAAVYLHDLYTIFGDWALAMAAYNSGEPRVMEAVVKNGRANFWELYDKQLLPKETRDYVPKILAAIRVAREADSYGFISAGEIEAAAGQ